MRRMKYNYSDSLIAVNAQDWGRTDLEKGDKILIPSSALNSLANSAKLDSPWIFCLKNTYYNKQIYAGVLEFVAPEGKCILPNWMFRYLECYDGIQLIVTNVPDIPAGKFIKIQPHETAFIELSNPRAILEKELLNYTCLMQGGQINIQFMNKNYLIDVLEVKNKNNQPGEYRAILVTNQDIEVEFEKPKDYIEDLPSLTKKTSSVQFEEQQKEKQQNDQLKLFSGQGVSIGGKPVDIINQQIQNSEIQKTDTYNPRLHKLKNGVRSEQNQVEFQGSGISIGNSTREEQQAKQLLYNKQQQQSKIQGSQQQQYTSQSKPYEEQKNLQNKLQGQKPTVATNLQQHQQPQQIKPLNNQITSNAQYKPQPQQPQKPTQSTYQNSNIGKYQYGAKKK